MLVIFLFLRNLSATIIPSLALPMSIIGTFAVMYLLGYSLDNLSLMALTLSVGFVVDDAIVMLENIVRHMEMGEGALEAALRGSREIGFTIVSMTLSLAAVFIPVLFMGGIVGRLLHEFAVTIGVAILVSGFVSLTLTPMLCSRFLRHPRRAAARPAVPGHRAASSTACCDVYGWTLRRMLRHRDVTLAVLVLLLVGTGYLLHGHAQGLHPERGHRQIFGSDGGGAGHRFDAMVEHQQAGRGHRQADPNVEAFTSTVSAAATPGASSIRLKPRRPAHAQRRRGHRRAPAEAGEGARHAGVPAEPAAHPHRRPADREPVPVHAAGPDTDELYALAPAMRAEDRSRHPRPHRRHERPADQEPAGAVKSTATRPRRSA